MKSILEYILNNNSKVLKSDFEMPNNIKDVHNQKIIKDLIDFGHINFLSLCEIWEVENSYNDEYAKDLHIAYSHDCEFEGNEYYGIQFELKRHLKTHLKVVIANQKSSSSGTVLYQGDIKDFIIDKEQNISKKISELIDKLITFE